MIEKLPIKPIPSWLANPDLNSFSLKNILHDSCYYPACGLDGTPIRNLAGNIHSFIYVDYSVSRESILRDLHSSGFSWMGFECVFCQELSMKHILPDNWQPTLVPSGYEGRERFIERSRWLMREYPSEFIYWTIWLNNKDNQMFSLLYIREEMSACYQGLYYQTGMIPIILSLIQPGAMGGEWEATATDDSFFKRVIKRHPKGLPKYLIYGGYGLENMYQEPCWSEYKGNKVARLQGRYASIWKLNSALE